MNRDDQFGFLSEWNRAYGDEELSYGKSYLKEQADKLRGQHAERSCWILVQGETRPEEGLEETGRFQVVAGERLKDISDMLTTAKDELRELTHTFQGVLTETAEVKRLIARSALRPAMEELCHFYQKLELAKKHEVQKLAEELKYILQGSLGLEPILPPEGSCFDSRLHERRRSGQRGGTITVCHSCGWSLDGQPLLRAVVDTEGEEEKH